MTTAEDVETFLRSGNESTAFEVKGPGDVSDPAYVAKVARAVMAMGNNRDGGLVCLGVDDDKLRQMRPGLSAEQAAAWVDMDVVGAKINAYADPQVNFRPVRLHVGDDETLAGPVEVVVLDVQQFESAPHVCKKTFQDPSERNKAKPPILKTGQVYVRSLTKPESVPVPDAAAMRRLVDLAVDQGIRRFLRQTAHPGPSQPTAAAVSDDDRFDTEAQRVWSEGTAAAGYLAMAAHLEAQVRPMPYGRTRLDSRGLVHTMRESASRLRGWPVPYVGEGRGSDTEHAPDWAGQSYDDPMGGRKEVWRLTTTGLFLHRRNLVTDRKPHAREFRQWADHASGTVSLAELGAYAWSVVEVASTLGLALGADSVGIRITLGRVARRQLVHGTGHHDFDTAHVTAADTIPAAEEVPIERLISEPDDVALDLVDELCRGFGAPVRTSRVRRLHAPDLGAELLGSAWPVNPAGSDADRP